MGSAMIKEQDLLHRVSYAETDRMGIVYYAHYLVWFERGRIEFMRNLGISYKEIEERGLLLPVIEVNCTYKGSTQFDDMVVVKTNLLRLKHCSVIFGYNIFRFGDKKLLAQGQTKHLLLNKQKQIVSIPKDILEKLKTIPIGQEPAEIKS